MTLATAPTQRTPRRASAKIRQAKRQAQAQTQALTNQIMTEGATAAKAAREAAAITHAYLTPAEQQAWIEDMGTRLKTIQMHPEQNLGHIEEQIARAVLQPLRLVAQRAAQAKANATPCQCPKCQIPLLDQKYLARTIDSRFGPLRIFRGYGWCVQCQEWHFPADYALGLGQKAPASPYIQEITALLVTKMPPEQAVLVAERLGLDLSRCTLHREAHRQGLKAQKLRAQTTTQLDDWDDLKQLARQSEGPPLQPFTMIIEIDAWNIRERDHWGQTKTLREQKKDLERWHWVYMGTVFHLDHRGQTAGHRAIISQRGYVATRLGLDELTRQLYAEALQRGMAQARDVLVIADGALWIWNLTKDRFSHARQRLDLYHAEEHLWTIANERFGKGTPEARAWVAPLLEQIRDDQTLSVIATLNELKPHLLAAEQEKLQTQIQYFENNADRMKYKEIIQARKALEEGNATIAQRILANEPLGSGAIESTCRQYQCRFKRTGQFWTMSGDEALLCLETFWRNGRWNQLYPHAAPVTALN
jgi:hypothetical protein